MMYDQNEVLICKVDDNINSLSRGFDDLLYNVIIPPNNRKMDRLFSKGQIPIPTKTNVPQSIPSQGTRLFQLLSKFL